MTTANIGNALALVGAVAYETQAVGHRWRFSQRDAEEFDSSLFNGLSSIREAMRRERRDADGRKYYAVSDETDAPGWHDVRDALQVECWAAAHEAFRQVFGERPLPREEWVAALNPPDWGWAQGDVPVMECLGIFVGHVRAGGVVYAEDIRGMSDLDVVQQFRWAIVGRTRRRPPLPPWIVRALASSILARESFEGDQIKGWAAVWSAR